YGTVAGEDARLCPRAFAAKYTHTRAAYADALPSRGARSGLRARSSGLFRSLAGSDAGNRPQPTACGPSLLRQVVGGRKDAFVLGARHMKRIWIRGPCRIVIIDVHRRHAAAGREAQPHGGPVGIGDVAFAVNTH